MIDNAKIAEFNNSDGFTPQQVAKLNSDFASIASCLHDIKVQLVNIDDRLGKLESEQQG